MASTKSQDRLIRALFAAGVILIILIPLFWVDFIAFWGSAISLFFLFVGFLVFIYGLLLFKMKRDIENIPVSKIRSLAMGMVEIFGKAVPAKGHILKDPVFGKECVYYNYAIEEFGGKDRRGWVAIKKGEERPHFFLKDNTGLVLIDPKGAIIEIQRDFEWKPTIRGDPPPHVKKYFQENNIEYKTVGGLNRSLRIKECFIKPGEELYVMGMAGDNPFVEEAMAQHSIEDVMIQRGEGDYYFISDKPKKGMSPDLARRSFSNITMGIVLITISSLFFVIYTGLYKIFL